MSRAGATKAAKEKTKPAAPQTPVTATEIVPGKFNESDWNLMVERDNAEEFIFDLVDELLVNTMDAIYKLYIERQLLPFTITMAKDAILQIIEWQFLARDEGEEGLVESCWTQDEEPDAAVTDCWAQGSVPKTEIPIPTPVLEEEDEEEKAASLKKDVNIHLPEEEAEKLDAEQDEKVSDSEEPLKDQDAARKAAETEKKEKEETKQKRKVKYKPYRGKLASAGVSKMTESLEESAMKMAMAEAAEQMQPPHISSNVLTMPASCASLVKVQNGRPPGSKEVEYDELGNVIAVMRLDAEKLPNHRVTVKYTVVDSTVETAQTRLEAVRRGQVMAPIKASAKLSKSLNTFPSETPLTGKGATKLRKPAITPHPPSLLETMDVASGVTVTEAGRTKKGPGRTHVRKLDLLEQHQKDLQPVTIKIKTTAISVSDLLDRTTPILRPLDEARPLPPITPKPPILT